MTLLEAQKAVDSWINKYGIRYFSELTNTAILSEEVGELSSLMARIYGDQSFKKDKQPKNIKESLESEMADVLFVLVCLANQTGIDLQKAFIKNLDKKAIRDAQRHRDNDKLA